MNLFGKTQCTLIGVGPVLPVRDIEATVAHYCSKLGFELDFVMGEPPDHGSVTRGRVGIQFTLCTVPFEPSSYPGWTYLFVENIDELASEYHQRGLVFTRQLASHGHGMREFELLDCNGYRLRFGQYLSGS